MQVRSAREIGVALAAACLVLFLFTRYADTPALRGLETASLDLRFRLRGVQAPGPGVTIILVDDASIATFGRWPFPRSLIAQAVRRLTEAGAKSIAFDLLFAEPERASSHQADDPDAPLEQAIPQSGTVLLPLAFAFVGPSGEAPDYLSDSAFAKFDESARSVVFPLQPIAVLPPIERFGKAAHGLGNVNIAYDRDGAVRFDRSVLPFDGDFYPSLAIRAAADYLGVPWPDVRLILGQGIQIGETLIPTDQSMRLPINFRGPPGTMQTFSFADLIGGHVPEDRLKGRVVLIALLLAGLQAAFQRGLWLPAVQPAAALTASLACVLLVRYWTVDRAGQRVRSAFRRYMAPALVDVLAAHPERLRLGGETRTMTLMFCDIRGFTAISEQFQADPQGLTRLINRFLSPMTEVITAHRGTIDKYMGDCIMAFWNARLDDADHAALAMTERLAALNRSLTEDGLRPLAIGIGLNSGACVVGNMGSDLRFDYSVLGDAVNLSSRLEGLSKSYGVAIVIGPATRAAARSPAFTGLQSAHAAMLERYRARDWTGARQALDACRAIEGHIAVLCDLYDDRMTNFLREPPAEDWTGVFIATSK